MKLQETTYTKKMKMSIGVFIVDFPLCRGYTCFTN
ncbi:hypothetical protein VEHBASIW_CDS0063 [Salmonella phage vB_SalP_QS]|uniref:Uncharacterized protein n=2 Tax=unclassified bacterial viruses TaxID=12333 RepID=A0AB39C4L7_9VIRU